jgi:hypothetical protein
MKNVLFASAALVMLVMVSCSKEAKLNRKIDGVWNVVTYDGAAMAEGYSTTYTFTKDKKGVGTYKSVYVYPWGNSSISVNDAGTYTLLEDTKLTLQSTTHPNEDPEVFTVMEYSKTDLKTAELVSGKITTLKKAD